MGLVEDLNAAVGRPKGEKCSVALLLAALPDEEREALLAALANPEKMGSTIGAVLRAHGHHVQDSTVQRHRRGACQCP